MALGARLPPNRPPTKTVAPYAARKAGSLLTKVIADRGRITVPGGTVRSIPPEIVHPDTSIACVPGL